MIHAPVCLLLLAPAAAQPTEADARVLSGIVATAIASNASFEVLTAEDVRTATDFEATRQLMGCTESSSCLVELANALDARFVVTGNLGALGDELVLQLSTMDVKSAKAVGRHSLRALDTPSLATQAEAAIARTLDTLPKSDVKERVVVLDFTLVAPSAAAPAATVAPSGPSALTIGGGITVGAGMVVLLGAVFSDVMSANVYNDTNKNTSLSAAAASASYDVSDGLAIAAVVGYGGGALLVLGGSALFILGLASE